MWVDLGVHLISASLLLMKTVLCFVIPSLLEGVALLSRQQVAV